MKKLKNNFKKASCPPRPTFGSTWLNTDDNQFYRYSGKEWITARKFYSLYPDIVGDVIFTCQQLRDAKTTP